MQMKTWGARLVAVVVIAMSAAASMAAEIKWAKDWADAQRQATASNKLVMIDFYTDWCGWCKKLDKDTYSADSVVKASASVVSVKINAEKEGVALAKKYGVSGFPTILFVDAKGVVAGRIVGYLPAEPFKVELEGIVGSSKRYPALVKEIAGKPNDGKLNAELASVLAKRGDLPGARAALAKVKASGLKDAVAVEAFLAVGDALQSADQYDDAIVLFSEAIGISTDARRQSYGLVSVAICQMSSEKLADAKATAQKIIDLKGADPEHVETAKRILDVKPKG